MESETNQFINQLLTRSVASTEKEEIVSDVIENLFDKIDFLGYQLSEGEGSLSEKELESLSGYYLTRKEISKELLKKKIKCILPFIKNTERIDADHFSMLFDVDMKLAQEALNDIRKEQLNDI